MKKIQWTAMTIVLALMGCQQTIQHLTAKPKDTNVVADQTRIEAHVRFLADDLLEGRDAGSRGHELAANYLASHFAQYGLEPAGDNDTYFQVVPFRKSTLLQSSPKLTLTVNGEKTALTYPKDYLTGPSSVSTESAVSGGLVFVGYGIVSEELGHNDYQGLDVNGKVVVMLSGKPQSFPSEQGAHVASGREKSRNAAERGAVGIVTITTPRREKVRPYKTSMNYIHTPSLRWLDKQGMPGGVYPQIKNSAYFSKEAAAVLFAGAALSLEDIYAALEKDETPKGFALKASIDFTKSSEHETITSPNVVAKLPGTDPTLKDEYVVFTAHSDHIGISKSVQKDKINNGAMDNATGTSVLIEMARLFSNLSEKPKRSVLFVAVTAEEKGLLGSDYFASNPTVPQQQMTANVNLDMPILTYEFKDVIAFGAEHSDMKATVERAANSMGINLMDDPVPDMNLFTRSDHYSFVKQGVPSLFVVPGWTAVEEGVSGKEQFFKFLGTDYHKPTDEVTDAFNWNAARKFTEVNFKIGYELATQQQRAQWNEGNFFGDTFSKQ